MEVAFEMLGLMVVYYLVIGLVGITFYVLMSLGLYTIARRRGIDHAWLAWLPVGNVWILGSIADNYRKVTRGETKNRRTLMLVLNAVTFLLAIIVMVNMFGAIFEMIADMDDLAGDYYEYEYEYAYSMDYYDDYYAYEREQDEIMEEYLSALVSSMGLMLIMMAVAVVSAVFQYICLYELYESCDPNNKILYLLLSIFLGLTSIFVFVCRNKDYGMRPAPQPMPYGYMPPQQWQQPQYQQWQQPPQYQQPQYQQPQPQPPQEPWQDQNQQ